MTRVLLDACVLFPSVMREILLGAAKENLMIPLWSDRILEEWRRAALRKDPEMGAVAATEIMLLRVAWPDAIVDAPEALQETLLLPDLNDIHVLAAAIHGQAAELVTANLRDFPTRILAGHGVIRRDPDGLLLEMAHENPPALLRIVETVLANASQMSGKPADLRKTLRKTGLPRLGKFLAAI